MDWFVRLVFVLFMEEFRVLKLESILELRVLKLVKVVCERDPIPDMELKAISRPTIAITKAYLFMKDIISLRLAGFLIEGC